MPINSFRSDLPHLAGADAQFEGANAKHARRLEELLVDPAYMDPHNPKHYQVKADVQSLTEHLYGEAPIDGGQPFGTFTFQTGPVTVGDGQGTADEHVITRHD